MDATKTQHPVFPSPSPRAAAQGVPSDSGQNQVLPDLVPGTGLPSSRLDQPATATERPSVADRVSPAADQSAVAPLSLLTTDELTARLAELAAECLRRGRRELDGARRLGVGSGLLTAGERAVHAAAALQLVAELELEHLQGFDADDFNGRPRLVPERTWALDLELPHLRAAPTTSAAPEPERLHGAADSGTPLNTQPSSGALTTSGAADSLPEFDAPTPYAGTCAGCGSPTVALYCAACNGGRR